ncbi:MAG: monovalent cation/H+ antiporter subunit D family protein [Desulfobacterales bacterium]|nr:monovalent cation/H+ antiporter subunit D family protein [Desulfobacterales bacterium]
MGQQLPVIIIIVPLIASLVISFIGWRYKRFTFFLAITALFVCLISSVSLFGIVLNQGDMQYHMGGWMPPMGIEYKVDHLAVFMLVLISFLGFLTAVYSKKIVEKEMPDKVFLFWCLYLLLITGLLGIIVTGDLFNLFVLLEVASLTGYSLVAVGNKRATVAGFRYLIIGTIGACFYLLGVGYLYIATGTLNMGELAQLLPAIYESKTVITSFVFIFIGFAIKIALFPLHAWQPDAYTHAPSAVSIIISTAVAKTFIYALIRIIFSVYTINFIKTVLPVFNIICWIAAMAIIVGSVYAIVQDNLKRMLAYSSIANVGYIVLGIGLAASTSLGLTPVIMHLLNHAIIKSAMFMVACGFIYKFNLWNISDFTGLSRKMPYSALVLIIASLAMIGLPPGAGFVSKWYLILAVIDAGQYPFVAVIFISTLLMLVYFWRIIETMYIKPPNEPENKFDQQTPVEVQELPGSMLIPSVIMAALTFIIGLVWISGMLNPFLNTLNLNFGLGVIQ